MKLLARDIPAKGTVVDFTKDALAVVVAYRRPAAAWSVTLYNNNVPLISDPRTANFDTRDEAAQYAGELVDDAKTLELKWWRT